MQEYENDWEKELLESPVIRRYTSTEVIMKRVEERLNKKRSLLQRSVPFIGGLALVVMTLAIFLPQSDKLLGPLLHQDTGQVVQPPTLQTKGNPLHDLLQNQLTDFQMFADGSGYAWEVNADSLRMYRTENDGETWVNVSPSSNEKFIIPPKYGKDIFFYDNQHGWIARGGVDGKQSVLLYTENGGEDWKSASLPDHTNIIAMDFVSPESGWLLTSSDSAMGHSEKSLYVTKDGGGSWEKIMQNTGYIASENPTKEAIPQSGYAKGMVFRDAQNGWVPLDEQQGIPHMYRTMDGGHTWKLTDIPVPNKNDSACDFTSVSTPVFFGDDHKNGWYSSICRHDTQERINGYFTDDSGEHWNYAPFALEPTQATGDKAPIVFLNDKEGWYLNKDQVYRTTDRGQNWLPLKADSVLTDTLKNYPQLTQVQFISSKVGWLLLETTELKKSILLKTSDGGNTWTVL